MVHKDGDGDRVLIVESAFHADISECSLSVVQQSLERYGKSFFDVVTVPRVFEIAHAMNLILESREYDGVVILGCVLRLDDCGELMLSECVKSANELSIHYSVPLGCGIMFADDIEQARQKATKCSIEAVTACLALMKIKSEFHSRIGDIYSLM